MDRVIKFRAWDKEKKEMIMSNHLSFHEYVTIEEQFADDEFIFMQFTGLKDKNGKEIYEGDIVKLKTIDHEKGGWVSNDKAQGVVEFNDVWGIRFVCKDHTQRTADMHWKSKSRTNIEVNHITIIGNIHKNPELLK